MGNETLAEHGALTPRALTGPPAVHFCFERVMCGVTDAKEECFKERG